MVRVTPTGRVRAIHTGSPLGYGIRGSGSISDRPYFAALVRPQQDSLQAVSRARRRARETHRGAEGGGRGADRRSRAPARRIRERRPAGERRRDGGERGDSRRGAPDPRAIAGRVARGGGGAARRDARRDSKRAAPGARAGVAGSRSDRAPDGREGAGKENRMSRLSAALVYFFLAAPAFAAEAEEHAASASELIFPLVNLLLFLFIVYRFGLPLV